MLGDRQTHKQTDRHTDRQTDRNTPITYRGGLTTFIAVIIIIIMTITDMLSLIRVYSKPICNG